MNEERWHRIEALYHDALKLGPEEREQFLERACEGDESLRTEVESLISSHESTADFLASPAFSLGIRVLANSQDETIRLEPGARLGHYEVLSRLGSGGMGVVYRAKDTRLERPVAVKLLPTAFSNEPDALKRFEQEARAASGVSHPNIAHIYDIGKAEEHHYIAMEYIEGDSLRVLLNRGPLSASEAIKIARQVAEALYAAHTAGIIHRDIKPEN
ncbi:MAG: serine/threonine protein kinase, partial [Acidobacteriota bacterium]|nr:serine/threonine protein kinase [Acidobacteriota bacterium]